MTREPVRVDPIRPCADMPAVRTPPTPLAKRTVSGRTLFWIALGLYVIFAAIRIGFSLFPKTIDVMPDELRYLGLARSLFTDGSLVLRGDEATFQKILYPLSLFPALIFHDTIDQVRAIGILNSLYVCSAVFPTYLFGQKIFKDRLLPNLASLLLVLLMPDMCYSMTFMSESLFFPVALWLAYLIWRTLCDTTRAFPILCLASGAACYVAYLCKEVAAAYAIAFILLMVILGVRKSRPRNECLMGTACFAVGFLAPFVLMKATLFAGMGNSYSQTDPSILLSPYTWAFAIYAFVTDFTYLLVGFAFFCLVFPLIGWRRFPSDQRRLLAFCLLSVGIGLLVILYTISIREDVGHVALRQHLRYVIPLFIPLMMLFMEQVHTQNFSRWKHRASQFALFVGTVVTSCLLVATMFGSANLSQGFDSSQFHLLDYFSATQPLDQQEYDAGAATMTDIDDSEALLEINPAVWLSRAAIIAFIALGSIGLFTRYRKETYGVIMAVIFICCVANNAGCIQYNWKAYGIAEDEMNEAIALDQYLESLPDDVTVLIVSDTDRTQRNNLTDTYIQDRTLSYRYCTDTAFAQNATLGYLDQSALLGTAGLSGGKPYGEVNDMTRSLSHINYILVSNNQDIHFTSKNVIDTGVGSHKNFILYRITDSKLIRVEAHAPDND